MVYYKIGAEWNIFFGAYLLVLVDEGKEFCA